MGSGILSNFRRYGSIDGLATALLSVAASAHLTSPAPLAETTGSAIGYKSVSDALAALRTKPGVVFTTENGWTIATDNADLTIWSFAPAGYPAYPAVVKRHVASAGSGSLITMSVECEASKAACDDLVRLFAKMNRLGQPSQK